MAKPKSIKLIPNPISDVKKFANKLKIHTNVIITAHKTKRAKIKKNEKPKIPTESAIVNKKIETNKIIGNHIGKNIILRNNSNMFYRPKIFTSRIIYYTELFFLYIFIC